MGVARLFRCPACGGEVDEAARACPYCRAPLATVRCAACFHMNVAEAVHCSGCGRDLGLEPIGEASTLACPRCSTRLESLPQGPGALFDCPSCGGQFVENALLRDLLERQRVVPGSAGGPPSSRVPPEGAVRYLPCPECSRLMHRRNFGRSSGIIVDVCSPHGIWFDRGELPRVLAFVAGGGLERAELRRREEERLAESRARTAGPPSAGNVPTAGPDLSEADLVDGLADAAQALLGYVRALMR
mgnify:CR=1 FL=1